MSAVLPFLEQRPRERGHHSVLDGIEQGIEELRLDAADLRGLGKADDVDDDGTPLDPLAKPHTELTRLYWARTLVANALVGAKFRLGIEGADVTIFVEPTKEAETAMLDQGRSLRRDVVAWHFSGNPLRAFKLFSTNSKMRCPTFDLPAGMGQLGGACPGAAYAQSTVPEAVLQSVKGDGQAPDYGTILVDSKDRGLNFLLDQVQADWDRLAAHPKHREGGEQHTRALNLKSTVCQYCYASGGKYGEVTVQFNELARFAFVKALVRKNPDLLVGLLTKSIIAGLKWDEGQAARFGIRPIRVHSSGDFYNTDYAKVWLKVAYYLHQHALRHPEEAPIVLWAPTRTHVLPAFNKFWQESRDEGRIPPNFIIRPSAYSVGDPAPYINAKSPTGSAGTSVLFEDDTRPRINEKGKAEFGDGTKFDWQCGVYALAKGNKTCLSAIGPDGKEGCRACWKRPDLAVNYVIH